MINVESLQECHWEEVRKIYLEGIGTKNATFETETPSWEEWNQSHHLHSRFVVVENGNVIGWVAISKVSKRYAYRGVAEVSVYVSLDHLGKGIGTTLMKNLIQSSEKQGIWTLYSSLFPENRGSIALHTKHGFRCIGRRERIAELDGVWRDTVLYERRSKKL